MADKEIFELRSEVEFREIPIFFIVGKGRSGSTLLQFMLDAHPNILIPLESRFLVHTFSRYHNLKHWDENTVRRFHKDLFTEKRINIWQINREKLLRQMLDLKNPDFSRLCRLVYLNYISLFPKESILLIGDKHPFNTLFIPWLLKVFPEAKFIHLNRDYRDNVLSHQKAFNIKAPAFVSCVWMHYNQAIEIQREKFPERFHYMSYEELVSNPGSNLKNLCSFLDIPFDQKMLDYSKYLKPEYSMYESFTGAIHANLVNPVSSASVGVWKEKLLPGEIAFCEYIAGKQGEKYGYQRSGSKFGMGIRIRSEFTRLKFFVWLFFRKSLYRLPFVFRKIDNRIFDSFFDRHFREFEKKKNAG